MELIQQIGQTMAMAGGIGAIAMYGVWLPMAALVDMMDESA